ncbi:hypothetical protein BKA93DRAFT_826913 [Sparassis latifolia]
MDGPANRDLVDGLLLLPEGCTQRENVLKVNVCRECLGELYEDDEDNRPPSFSLANDLWIGDIPFALQTLTVPEQYLIARNYVHACIFKLYPKDRKGGFNPETLQSGMKGNVTTYELNTERIVDMLHGDLLPRSMHILADVISVTYVGLGQLPKNWLRSTFRVCRFHVARALNWLKEHNRKYYDDMEINMEMLSKLPEDDIPDEILAVVHQETDVDMIERESAGAVDEETPINMDECDPGE